MNVMKSLIKKIAKNHFSIMVRNLLGVKPLMFKTIPLEENQSISDAFIWRTDNSYKTVFKYSDLLRIFFNEGNKEVELYFYDKDNRLIKQLLINNINLSNQLIIDKDFIGQETYGKFFIFHKNKSKLPISIINKCYLGFSQNNNLPSFVHGNALSANLGFDEDNNINSDIVSTSFFMNRRYRIQNYFKLFDKTELFFTNPTSKKVRFNIGSKIFTLKNGCSEIVKIKDIEIIDIKSNCYFLRPIIFNYKSKYIDVHHA